MPPIRMTIAEGILRALRARERLSPPVSVPGAYARLHSAGGGDDKCDVLIVSCLVALQITLLAAFPVKTDT
jgi:hypothetical protein